MQQIVLGSEVKDVVSGLTGVAVSRIKYLNDCVQYGVQQKVRKDGKVPATEYVDEEQLRIIKGVGDVKNSKKPPGGPSRYAPKK